MNLNLIFLLTSFYCMLLPAKAQFSSCNVLLSTVVNNKPVVLKSADGVLLLNIKSGDLTLRVSSGSFFNERDTVTTRLFQDNDDIVFIGNIQNNILQIINQQANGGKNFPMTGTLSINHLTLSTKANYSAFKMNNQRDDLARNLKMSVFITFPAAAARLNKITPLIQGDVVIQVNEGTTNIIE
jgi:hypothetical protein